MRKQRKRQNLSRTTRREDAGKFLLDVSKLVIGSVVIGGLLRMDFPQDILLIIGLAFAIVLFVFGLFMAARKIQTDKTPVLRRKRRRRRK